MPKKILLIENEPSFAGQVSRALEATGLDVRMAADGREGLELARDWNPDGIVLCVELAGMSGYLVCQKLKKDDALKSIPLVLTSAEATQETFDKHRTLKARADEYLLKPYSPESLLEKLGALVGLPEPAPAEIVADEELISLEDELGLQGGAEPEAELIRLDDEGRSVDEDLKLLDDAFDDIAAPLAAKDAAAALDELPLEKPVDVDAVDGAALPEEDEGAAGALAALGDEADATLGSLDDLDETLSRGLRLGDREAAEEREKEERDEVHRELEALSLRAEEAEREAAQEKARAAEQARAAAAEAEDLRRKLADAEKRALAAEEDARRKADEAAAAAEAMAGADSLERELEQLRTELLVARGEVEGARNEVEKRTAEAKKRVAELEAASAKNEERVVKAYQKIKADEKIREKVRKALAIATQLLDDGVPAESAAERERRAALVGRE